MILADTSVWIAHFRVGDGRLGQLLADGLVALHPFVWGEIAAGNLRQRTHTLANLALLPKILPATEAEVHHLLKSHRLWGSGLGWINLHLLTAARLSGSKIYTHDRALRDAAHHLAVSFGVA